MEQDDLIEVMLDWSTTFIRISLHDFNRYTRNTGLSLAQMTVLMHLYYQGASEVMNFCEMMQVSPAGASQMIERMVQQGVVQRSEAPDDRRVRLVNLTEAGRALVQESITARQAWLENLTAGLSPHEREQIITALKKLTENAARMTNSPL